MGFKSRKHGPRRSPPYVLWARLRSRRRRDRKRSCASVGTMGAPYASLELEEA
jgi:hypothetical protein